MNSARSELELEKSETHIRIRFKKIQKKQAEIIDNQSCVKQNHLYTKIHNVHVAVKSYKYTEKVLEA